MVFSLLSLILPFTLSYLLISAPLRQSISGPPWALILLKALLAAGLALGGTSCLFFLWLVVAGHSAPTYGWFEQALLGILVLMWLAFQKSDHGVSCEKYSSPDTVNQKLCNVLLAIFCYVTLTRLVRFVGLSLNSPFGDVDATYQWTLRARFLFSGGDEWGQLISSNIGNSANAGYPLLLPATIARFWIYWGDDSQIVPAAVAGFFTFAIIGLGFAALTILRTRSQGLLVGIALAGTSYLIAHGATQYADVPLAFYFMATLVLCCLHDKAESGGASLLVLAGLMAGLAAWTKNEGGVFAVMVLVARLVTLVPLRGWRIALREMLVFSAGVAPLALFVLFFKTQIVTGITPIASQGVSAVMLKLKNISSYMEVGQAIASKMLRVGHPGLALFAVYWWLVGESSRPNVITLARPSAIVVSLMLFSYCFIFVITPFNSVGYQLATSLDRLWLHLWPSAMLFFFLRVCTPEEAMGQENSLTR